MEDGEGDVINETVHCTVSVPKRWIILYSVKSHEAKTSDYQHHTRKLRDFSLLRQTVPMLHAAPKAENHCRATYKLIADLHLFVLQ